MDRHDNDVGGHGCRPHGIVNSDPIYSQFTTALTYDVLTVSDPNGMLTTYSYNNLNELSNETVTNASNQTLFFEHTDWYDDGMKEDVVDKRYSGGTLISQITTSWSYDGLNRLTKQLRYRPEHPGQPVCRRLIPTTSTMTSISNSVRETINGGSGVSGGSTINYTYNADDQLLTEVETSYGNITVYSTTYSYDVQGNLLRLRASQRCLGLYQQ